MHSDINLTVYSEALPDLEGTNCLEELVDGQLQNISKGFAAGLQQDLQKDAALIFKNHIMLLFALVSAHWTNISEIRT